MRRSAASRRYRGRRCASASRRSAPAIRAAAARSKQAPARGMSPRRSLEAIGDPTLGQVIGGEFDEHLVAHQHADAILAHLARSEEHTSELQSLMRISYAVFCLKKKKKQHNKPTALY